RDVPRCEARVRVPEGARVRHGRDRGDRLAGADGRRTDRARGLGRRRPRGRRHSDAGLTVSGDADMTGPAARVTLPSHLSHTRARFSSLRSTQGAEGPEAPGGVVSRARVTPTARAGGRRAAWI